MARTDYHFAFNVSNAAWERADFMEWIIGKVREYGIEPGRIEFEILEDVANSQLVKNSVKRLKSLGCKIAIDDLGTMKAGLNRTTLRVDTLKLDKEIVQNLLDPESEEARLIDVALQLSKKSGFEIVAE